MIPIRVQGQEEPWLEAGDLAQLACPHIPMQSQTPISPEAHIPRKGMEKMLPKIPSHSCCNDFKIPTQICLVFLNQTQFDFKLFIKNSCVTCGSTILFKVWPWTQAGL